MLLGIAKKRVKLPFSVGRTPEACDVFDGRWVWDKENRPLYEESECPYIQPQLTCQEHGRPEKDYQFWRWQPHGCSLPRFVSCFYYFENKSCDSLFFKIERTLLEPKLPKKKEKNNKKKKRIGINPNCSTSSSNL